MIEPINRIIANCPAIFFQRVLEHTDSGFGEALTFAKQHIDEPEKANMLGQLRHACCEAGFRKAAEESRLLVHASHTAPAGGRYSLVVANDVFLIRSNIQRHCGTPRPTNFRKTFSALNQWLEPLQLDMLETRIPAPADRLCGMIVTTVHPRLSNPSVPAFVGLGIPRSDLSGWAILMPITDLLARYHDKDTEERVPKAAPIEIKDRAVPQLKKNPNANI